MKLSAKQRQFCHEYIIDFNATQAYIRAGYAVKGANVSGPKLLVNPRIQAHLEHLISERAKRTEITSDYVLTNIREIAEEAREEKAHTQSLKAFELLGKHLKLFVERLEVSERSTVSTTRKRFDGSE